MQRFCTNCGQPLNEGQRFCTNCGTKAPAEPEAPRAEPAPAPPPAERTPVAAPPPKPPPAEGPPVAPTRPGSTPPAERTPVAPPPPPKPPPAERPPVPPPLPPPGRRLPEWWPWAVGVLVGAVLIGGGVAGAIVATGGKTHHRLVTTPPTTPSVPAQSPPSSTTPSLPPDNQAVLDTVNSHWQAIKDHDFHKAYSYLGPDIGADEASWVSSHQSDGIRDVSYRFSVTQVQGSSATVSVVKLQTKADADVSSSNPSGCLNWQGTYGMINSGGRWLIDSTSIQSSPC